MPADSGLGFNPVMSEASLAWDANVPEWASVEIDNPGEAALRRFSDCGAAARRTAAGRILVSADARAWTALNSGDDSRAGRAAAEIHAMFAGFARAQLSDFAVAPGVVSTPSRTLIMGVLNVTPDSFSDGGRFGSPEAALDRALEMESEGADIIDVGGESTRPGAAPVSEAEEIERVIPVVERIRGRSKAAISVDTRKSRVAAEALDAGATMVNDVTGLRGDPGMAGTAASRGAGLVVMHMLGDPRTMQANPSYADLFGQIARFLREGLAEAAAAGLPAEKTIVDPGIGFGKTVNHNLALIGGLRRFQSLGRAVLLGPSRKSFIGTVLGLGPGERIEGTAAAVAAGILNGCRIARVHDVKQIRRVAGLADAVKAAFPAGPRPAAGPAAEAV